MTTTIYGRHHRPNEQVYHYLFQLHIDEWREHYNRPRWYLHHSTLTQPLTPMLAARQRAGLSLDVSEVSA